MNRYPRTLALLAVAALLLAVGPAHASNLTSQLGILDLAAANGGINPVTNAAWAAGDQYRLVFVTSAARDALSGDVADYNAFVQNVAVSGGLGAVTWNAIASTNADWGGTATVDARDNTSTNPATDGSGVAIFLIDGTTKIADDYVDLWDGTIDNRIDRTESNGAYVAPAGSPFAGFGGVWTGTDAFGANRGRAALGGDSADLGLTIAVNSQWTRRSEVGDNDLPLGMYALSEPLTVAAQAVLFSPNATKTVSTPNGFMQLHDANAYTLNLDSGEIVLQFDGLALGLQNIDCIDQQDDGLFVFSTKANKMVVTPAGFVNLLATNAYRLEADGTITLVLNGSAMGGVDACQLTTVSGGPVHAE